MRDKKTWLGIIITLIAFYFFFGAAREVDFKQIAFHLKSVNYWYVFPAVFFIIFSVWIRAPRWRILLSDREKKISIWRLFRIALIGFMCNSIFPARLGEIVRPYILSKKENLSFPFVLSTIGLERVFDLFALVVFLSIVFLISPFPLEQLDPELINAMKKGGYISSLLLLFFIIFIFFVLKFPGKIKSSLDRFLPFLSLHFREKLKKLLDHLLMGLESIKSPKSIFAAMVYSLLVWFTIAFSEYMIILAFDLPVGLDGTAFIAVAIAFAVAAPSTPGYFGVFHYVCKAVLVGFFGVSEEAAIGVAVIMHAYQWIFIILSGLICLPWEGMTLRDIRKTKVTQKI